MITKKQKETLLKKLEEIWIDHQIISNSNNFHELKGMIEILEETELKGGIKK